jgi:hypothetical protein
MIGLGLVMWLGEAATCLAQTSQSDFRWQGKIAAGKAIEIKGVNGDIRAEATSGEGIEVVATKRARRNDPDEVKIQVIEHGDGVTICAVYPSDNDDRPNECRPGKGGRMNVRNNDVTVHFTVLIPSGVRFVGRTVNGSIEATALSDAVQAFTVNGSIRVSTGGTVEAATVNGSITAAMGSAGWTDTLEFTTVNGSITIDLPLNASTELQAETVNGDISTDFPIAIRGRISPRNLTGTIGSGGRQLDLKTVNGSIRLRNRAM